MPETNCSSSVPIHLLEIIGKELLRNFIRGYTNSIFSGVSCYYLKTSCEEIPSKESDLEFVNTENHDKGEEGHKGKQLHPYCTYYRFGCEQKKHCDSFDRQIVLEYYDNPQKGPMIYPCHRGLIDMTFPLRIGSRLVGVLFCGQIILKDSESDINWGAFCNLKDIQEYINWTYITTRNKVGNQSLTINDIIDRDTNLIDHQKKELKETITGNRIAPDTLAERFNDFRKFGEITQQLLEQLYESKQNAIQITEQKQHSDFLNDCTNRLLEAHLGKRDSWQSSLKDVFDRIQEKYDIERIGIFYGEPAGTTSEIMFNLFVMNSPRWRNFSEFTLQKGSVPVGNRIFPFKDLDNSFVEVFHDTLGCNVIDQKQLYVYPFAFGGRRTLIMMESKEAIGEIIKYHLQDIFIQVCRQNELAWALLREREAYETIKQHVIEIRHDLKTSVQLIVNNVQDYTRYCRHKVSIEDPEAQNFQQLVKQSINNHTETLRTINWTAKQRSGRATRRIILSAFLEYQVDLFRSTAITKNVRLELKREKTEKKCYIIYHESELNRAIATLLDNAIKYSYNDRLISIQTKIEGGSFVFEITNYGIGIPPEKLKTITMMDVRANVVDSKIIRDGTGLGLYIARSIFEEELHGQLKITSSQAPNLKSEPEPYHRYITTVKVSIPVHQE